MSYRFAVVRTPRSVYAAVPGRNKYRPSQVRMLVAWARACYSQVHDFSLFARHVKALTCFISEAYNCGILGSRILYLGCECLMLCVTSFFDVNHNIVI
jgi:hypothetical protein